MSVSNQFMLGNPIKVAESSVQPAVAISGNSIVTVYRDSTAVNSKLYYRSGTINAGNGTTNIGKAIIDFGDAAHIYADGEKGETPSVGVNSQGNVLELHEANGTKTDLWCNLGKLASDKKSITWTGHLNSGIKGVKPAVALAFVNHTTSLAVAAYISGDDTIHIMIGIVQIDTDTLLSPKSVTWHVLTEAFHGHSPKIALNDNGKVILVFDNNSGIISTVTGYLINNFTNITWVGQVPLTTSGSTKGHASVGLANNNMVVLAYQGKAISDDLVGMQYEFDFPIKTKCGKLNSDNVIEWSGGEQLGSGLGKKPVIATDGVLAACVQETPDFIEAGVTFNDSDTMISSSMIRSIYTNRSNWMSNYQTKTLRTLSLPAAHDAGMSQVGYCTNLAELHDVTGTKTQSKNFKEMLDCGMRYFDVRPVWLVPNADANKAQNTGHYTSKMGGIGCLGLSMETVYSGISSFISANHSEVIILKFSHYFQQTQRDGYVDHTTVDNNDTASASTFNPLKRQLIDYLYSTFSDNLYQKPGAETRRLVDIPISEICSNKTRIIAVFDHVDMDAIYPLTGDYTPAEIAYNRAVRACVYSYGDYYVDDQTQPARKSDFNLVVYDRYTNTDQLPKMVSSTTPSDTDHPGQIYQYKHAGYHSDSDLYLLSWTLTQQTSREVITGSPSIQTLAAVANSSLGCYAQKIIQDNMLSSAMIPNLVYVDFCDDFASDVCNFINATLYNQVPVV